MSLRYLSLFSGIESASVAWGPLGWHCVGVADIDPYVNAALAYHYRTVPNLGDVAQITEERIAALGSFDLVVFGSPCQDLSLMGKRKGFTGERSSLFFDAMQVAQWARVHCGVRFALWENVVGAFSSNDGRDFAAVVAAMAGLEHVDVPPDGWGNEGAAAGDAGMVEWSTLNSQWFGVAMQRRRLFALADFGDWASRCPVLLESEGLRGHAAPGELSWQETADDARPGAAGDRLVCVSTGEGAPGLPYLTVSNIGKTVNNQTPLLVFERADGTRYVRRFTPVECERLQGFEDNYTRVPLGNGHAQDNPRFRALGNTMDVRVMRWIGRSIEFAARWY